MGANIDRPQAKLSSHNPPKQTVKQRSKKKKKTLGYNERLFEKTP